MKWTRTPPTKSGFYYWQGGHLTGLQVAMVQVTAFKDENKPLEACELRADGFANAPERGTAASGTTESVHAGRRSTKVRRQPGLQPGS